MSKFSYFRCAFFFVHKNCGLFIHIQQTCFPEVAEDEEEGEEGIGILQDVG